MYIYIYINSNKHQGLFNVLFRVDSPASGDGGDFSEGHRLHLFPIEGEPTYCSKLV